MSNAVKGLMGKFSRENNLTDEEKIKLVAKKVFRLLEDESAKYGLDVVGKYTVSKMIHNEKTRQVKVLHQIMKQNKDREENPDKYPQEKDIHSPFISSDIDKNDRVWSEDMTI